MRRLFSHIPWLELLLLATLLSLVVQLVPELGVRLLAALDMRTWSRTAWFLMNLAVVAALVGFRYGPEWAKDWSAFCETRRLARRQRQLAIEKQQERELAHEIAERYSQRT